MLMPGSSITVTGSQARRDSYMCFFDTVELADGRVLDVDGPFTRAFDPVTAEYAPTDLTIEPFACRPENPDHTLRQ